MTDEEKKAIENTKKILKEWQKIVDIEDDIERDIEMNCYFEEMPFFEMKTLLEVIEKQEKEIKGKDAWIDTLEHNDKVYQKLIKEYERNFISKDKIREILILYDNAKKELVDLPNGETMCCSDCEELIEYLRKLLEEDE